MIDNEIDTNTGLINGTHVAPSAAAPGSAALSTPRLDGPDPDLTDNSKTVLAARYLIRDVDSNKIIETPRAMFERVAWAIAGAEEPVHRANAARTFYQRMARLEFLPNTPCLVNAGRSGGFNQFSACFVIPVPDTMSGVFSAMHQMAMTHKSGGGTGFAFSRLRAAGRPVRTTSGVASGPISFMRPFNASTEATKQGGVRRGANMGVLRVDHPDILAFIRIKADDLRQMENFNLSVGITDPFMESLERDREYALIHPDTGGLAGTLRARAVWDEIVRCAHAVGDPGLVFLDRVNAVDPLTDALGPIEATNPCVPGDTRILTYKGWRRIDDVVDTFVDVWNGEAWSKVKPRVTGNDQPIVKVTLSDGHTLRCTPAHRFNLADGTWSEARNLKIGDSLERLGFTPPVEGSERYPDGVTAYLHGFYQGDGYWNTEKQQHEINFYGAEKIAIAVDLERRGLLRLQPYSEGQDRRRGVIEKREGWPTFDKFHVDGDLDVFSALHWLAGLLDSDGNVVRTGTSSYGYQISSVRRAFLADVQMLLRQLGVPSVLALMKEAETKEMPGGTYDCQPCWRVTIAASSARRLQDAGLKTRRLACTDNNPDRSALRFPTVVSVEPDGRADVVYCFTEHERHRGVFDGVLTGQCGEVPLRGDDACSLGSINLDKFIRPSTMGGASFNFEALVECATDAVRFLDNMITLSEYPVPRIREVVDQSRKIGLGVMGWADALIRLDIPYASPQARDLAGVVMQTISRASILASESLARERGPFGAWEQSRYHKEGRTPRRHATTTVIAPTGSISIIAGCSSGIEPLYALSMTRNQAGAIMTEVHPSVARVGRADGWLTDKIAEAVRERGTLHGVSGVPDRAREMFAIANEIEVVDHVLMQAEFQKHVEDGVSKTINLRNSATPNDIDGAYRLAWSAGCKGITVYRDGCRDKQVLTAGAGGKAASSALAPVPAPAPAPMLSRKKIPKGNGRRPGFTFTEQTPFGNAHVTINEHPEDAEPFEVFVRIGKSGSEIMAWTEAFGRATSYLLAMPGPIAPRERLAEVAQQLADIGGGSQVGIGPGAVVSAPDAIAKVFRAYLAGGSPPATSQDVTQLGQGSGPSLSGPHKRARRESAPPSSATRFDLCPTCGKATLVREQRCGTCSNCGFSKC